MNRDILFRGFHKEENGKETIYIDGQPIKGKWCYGLLCMDMAGYISIQDEDFESGKCYEVIPETIGQYVGLDDKNGKKIFENDVVKAKYEKNNGYIKWNGNNASFQVNGIPSHTLKYASDLEVIGTIFDEENINIQDLNMHCDNCPDEIFSLCNRFCAYEDFKTALCCQPRFENMKVSEVEKIRAIFDKGVNDNEKI